MLINGGVYKIPRAFDSGVWDRHGALHKIASVVYLLIDVH